MVTPKIESGGVEAAGFGALLVRSPAEMARIYVLNFRTVTIVTYIL